MESRIRDIEKRLARLEKPAESTIQAIFLFKRDENGVESYKLEKGNEAVWIDRQTFEEHISHYKKEGVVICVPEKMGLSESFA